ncbi:MAG: chemotaxis protein CheW [Herminiimonas sp.]|nr:chemotaxis protein CheW [Herminiimonas sp.]
MSEHAMTMMTGGAGIDDCWNQIGIRGDSTCPQLPEYVHCRNCPTYSAAASILLDRALPDGQAGAWNGADAAPVNGFASDTESVMIFRIGAEWLGLPVALVREIAESRMIHSLPHQRNQSVLGIANIRGALVICVALAKLLGLDETAGTRRGHEQKPERTLSERMLVVNHDGQPAVFPVAEVHGIHRYDATVLKAAPTTVTRAAATCIRGVLEWRGNTVGVLDGELLFYALNRSLV